MWGQIARTSEDDLLKAVYMEERRAMKKKVSVYESKYKSNLSPYVY